MNGDGEALRKGEKEKGAEQGKTRRTASEEGRK
jgi:hypothetical protein